VNKVVAFILLAGTAAAPISAAAPELGAFTEVVEPARAGIYLGDIIPTEREQLYRQRMVDVDFADTEVSEIVRGLARSANINFIMPKLAEDPKITLRMQMNPFAALERVVEAQGMGLVRKDNVWLLQQVRKDHLSPRTYRLQNIHLDREFSFREKQGATSGIQASFNPNTGVSSASTSFDRVTNPVANTAPRAASDRSTTSSPILDNLERILDVGIRNALDPRAEKVELSNDEASKAKKPGGQQMFSYDPDSNALFVLATDQQHQWVSEYLTAIDVATYNVEIKVLFLSSSRNPSRALGVNWSDTLGKGIGIGASGVSTPKDDGTSTVGPIGLGTLRKPDLGLSTAILSASALNVTLQALLSNSDTSTNRYPVVNTYNNREVVIASTTNVPVVASTNTTQVQTSGTNVAAGSTNQASIINEEVGTVVRILPRVIQAGVLVLNVNIDVTNVLGSKIINQNEYPLISQTSSTTEVKIQSGYTAVIGGLEEMISKDTVNKVPVLGDIPFFGFGFKSIAKSQQKSTLSLLITARIVNERGEDMYPQQDAPKVAVQINPTPESASTVNTPEVAAHPTQPAAAVTASKRMPASPAPVPAPAPAIVVRATPIFPPPPVAAPITVVAPALVTEPAKVATPPPVVAPPVVVHVAPVVPADASPPVIADKGGPPLPLVDMQPPASRSETPSVLTTTPTQNTHEQGHASPLAAMIEKATEPAVAETAPTHATRPVGAPMLVASPATASASIDQNAQAHGISVNAMTPPSNLMTPAAQVPQTPKGPFEQSWTVDIQNGSAPLVSSALRIEHLDDLGRKVSRVIARGGPSTTKISGKYVVSPGISYRLIATATDTNGTRTNRDAGTFLLPR